MRGVCRTSLSCAGRGAQQCVQYIPGRTASGVPDSSISFAVRSAPNDLRSGAGAAARLGAGGDRICVQATLGACECVCAAVQRCPAADRAHCHAPERLPLPLIAQWCAGHPACRPGTRRLLQAACWWTRPGVPGQTLCASGAAAGRASCWLSCWMNAVDWWVFPCGSPAPSPFFTPPPRCLCHYLGHVCVMPEWMRGALQ